MAKQTFTTGQVLTAAQMTSLQQTAMGGGSATAKTASYTLVAADAGATVIMNSASATTITVNTSLFSAGDTVFIQNIGAGVSTITAGTATVNTASSLALAQYESGSLYFTAAGASIFSKADGAAAGGGGKVLQVVQGTTTSAANINTTTLTDTNLTATITPSLNTSKILVMFSQSYYNSKSSNACAFGIVLKRDSTTVLDLAGVNKNRFTLAATGATATVDQGVATATYLDAPATTSAITYKTQAAVEVASGTDFYCQLSSSPSQIILLEIGA